MHLTFQLHADLLSIAKLRYLYCSIHEDIGFRFIQMFYYFIHRIQIVHPSFGGLSEAGNQPNTPVHDVVAINGDSLAEVTESL